MSGPAWQWFGLDLLDAWARGRPAAEHADALDFLAALAAVQFPEYPGERNPDGAANNHRVADDGTHRAAFVADSKTIIGALYLASFRGPHDDAPQTRRRAQP